MSWRIVGGLMAACFLIMATAAGRGPDPLLPFLVYVGAASTALSIAQGRPVARWINVILVVFPGELALMTLLFEPAEQRALATTAAATLTRHAAVAALGMLSVATWAALLAVARPYHDASTPEL
jgi:hypothetical protein